MTAGASTRREISQYAAPQARLNGAIASALMARPTV